MQSTVLAVVKPQHNDSDPSPCRTCFEYLEQIRDSRRVQLATAASLATLASALS